MALAVEREGSCHLLSMTCRGQLYVTFKLPNLLDDFKSSSGDKEAKFKAIFCVSGCSKNGEILVGGYGWLKMIKVKIN